MQTAQPLVLFDGVCNFCNGSVNFLIKQDKGKKLKFAPLQSAAAQALLQAHGLPNLTPDSFILIEGQNAYLRSTAALRLLSYLPWYWQWARVFWIVPRFIRDAVYNLIAQNRYRWFGKKDTCIVPDAAVRSRFLE
jgi:predicted DCC family thiol-disulfide oxidoreductase YuxK